MKKLALLALVSILSLGACSPFQVRSDYDQSVSFNQYKTYNIRQNDLKLNDIDRGRVIQAIRQQMQARGFQYSENPDLIINIKATHKQIQDVQTTSPWGFGWGFGWGGPYWGMGYNRTYTDIYNQGALTLDFVDARTQKLVWQGIGSGLNVDNPKSKAKQIPEIVAEILKTYPPQQTLQGQKL
ncbi:DUF4136 domain-containing protein [Elizabethkingia sp. JS20170427COW]|uniref:DUF4136 domain-containing protein n=1 Tax=Elizabethkingia sp. JS20170427COW TaxID=2583851 RepID=UPI00111083B1|nr:DUF4136 domain-containing protein [Elizabethkingia sp. JS20170427COW]QCX52601.1 DUF4136 domain-containing protein [Elizabethkingia sp. JS20170427COW]